jgi:hypothetical protein
MHIDPLNQEIKITSIDEAVRLTPAQLSPWNILSITSRLNELPLNFPGARNLETLYFDDVDGVYPDDHLFAATPNDVQEALGLAWR